MEERILYALVLLFITFCVQLFLSSNRKASISTVPRSNREVWYIGTPEFFLDPFKFFMESLERAKGSMFSFKVRNNEVIVVRGRAGRDAFFSKGLDFMSGYRLLNPQLVDVMPAKEISGDESWASFMSHFIRSEVLEQLYPVMFSDVLKIIETWGPEGEVDPFRSVYELVFALSVRMATCKEFSEDRTKIEELMNVYKMLEDGSKPTSILLSWLPTPSRVRRTIAGARLYRMVSKVVNQRRGSGKKEDDPLQVLIDKGLSLTEITRFIAMTLFASVTNTGNVLCWIILYLQANPSWKSRVVGEIEGIQGWSSLRDFSFQISLPELETQMTDFELCTNETLRLLFTGPFMRRNIGGDISISGTRIDTGAFLMFPTADLHYDTRLYQDPEAFNPERFSPEMVKAREVEGITFLGWGAGRHACVGKRAANVMMKIIMCAIVLKFDMEVIDAHGSILKEVPPPYNDILFKVCPPSRSQGTKLRYKSKFQGA